MGGGGRRAALPGGGATPRQPRKAWALFSRGGGNRHDVDVLMTFMSDDCVFESTAGPEACGTRHAGRERVRDAFARVFKAFPDATFADARHFVAGNRGVSEWIFRGTTADGKKVEVNGCDGFTFENG